ncbi:hypothetical protein [Pseudomonas sp.]|uniref:hypothetical protein n=1 Tax=Pseudomonas sp. TaxID=306 RepID=UPI003FD75BF1
MRIRELVISILLLPALASAADVPPLDTSTDTFGKLLGKQAQLMESEMDLKIRQNQNQVAGNSIAGVTPLPGAKQEVNEKEPTVEAIWGLVGKEVAEINYKGQHLPVSMQEPFISKIDGWKLESIEQFEITLVRMSGNRVIQRKTVMLDWQGGGGSQPVTSPYMPQPSVITPPIMSPVIR